jgi:hypothetical protein
LIFIFVLRIKWVIYFLLEYMDLQTEKVVLFEVLW